MAKTWSEEVIDNLKKISGFQIPAHDTEIIDETDPNHIVITYKLKGQTVAIKDIVIDGAITTISVTFS